MSGDRGNLFTLSPLQKGTSAFSSSLSFSTMINLMPYPIRQNACKIINQKQKTGHIMISPFEEKKTPTPLLSFTCPIIEYFFVSLRENQVIVGEIEEREPVFLTDKSF